MEDLELCGVRCRDPGCIFEYKPRFSAKTDSTWSTFEKIGGGDGYICSLFPDFPMGVTLNNIERLVHPQLTIFLVAALAHTSVKRYCHGV